MDKDTKKGINFVLFLVLFGWSHSATANDYMKIEKAESLVKSGQARIISKDEMNEIKKKNIQTEIGLLNEKKNMVIKQKDEEVATLDKQREDEIKKINDIFDKKIDVVRDIKNSEVENIKKEISFKNSEYDLIVKNQELAKVANARYKEIQKPITIKNIESLKAHIDEYKQINNVILELSFIDSVKMYKEARVKKYNFGVLKKIKEYTLKQGYMTKGIDYGVFENMIEHGSDYDLEQMIKIIEKERGV